MRARILAYYDKSAKPLYLVDWWTESFVATREVGASVYNNFDRRPQEIPLLRDHLPGEALGWVKSLQNLDDGLYAEIELNERGQELLKDDTYRYVSPSLANGITLLTGETLEGWHLIEVSLTNLPRQFGESYIAELGDTQEASVYIYLSRPARVATNAFVPLGAVPFRRGPLIEDEDWDANDAIERIRKWASSDGSGDKDTIDWSKYRQAFAWYNTDDPQNFGSYKLPHHDVRNGQLYVHKRGVIAAAAALQGARGGVDIPEADIDAVKQHIASHYHQWGEKAPWERNEANRRHTMENITLTQEQLTVALSQAIQPLAQEIKQIKHMLDRADEERKANELARLAHDIKMQILSWRYGDDQSQSIPPKVAESFAYLLARMDEEERKELLQFLRANPPITVPLAQSAQPSTPSTDPLTPIQAHYAKILGVSPEDYIKYNRRDN